MEKTIYCEKHYKYALQTYTYTIMLNIMTTYFEILRKNIKYNTINRREKANVFL